MQDLSLQILIFKKAFPIKQLPRLFRCLEIVGAQDDKLNPSRVYENKTFL